MTVNDPISAESSVRYDSDPDVDRLFDALANGRRRFVLVCLHESDEPLEVDHLVEELARSELDGESEDVRDEDVTSVYLSLVHIHLPKLADVGLVEYDREENVVAPAVPDDELAPLVDLSVDGERELDDE